MRLFLIASMIVLASISAGCAPTVPPDTGEGLHPSVPSVVGMDLEQAEAALAEVGYEVGDVESSGTTENAVVARQDPVEGTTVPRGGEIDLVLQPRD